MARPAAVLTIVAAVLLFAPGSASAADAAVDVQDNAFVPAEVTVSVGDTVTWTQTGSNPHSVTADDGSFDSHPNCPGQCMGQGDTFQHTFDEAGSFAYHCKIHGSSGGGGMAGTVVVEGGDDGAEPLTVPSPQETPLAETGGAPAALLVLGAGLVALGGLAVAFLRRGRSGSA